MDAFFCFDCGVEMFEQDVTVQVEELGYFTGLCGKCIERAVDEGEIVLSRERDN